MNPNFNIILSTAEIDKEIDESLFIESKIFDFEFYQLIIDCIIFRYHTDESVENFLYYWIYDSATCNQWRAQISGATANHIAKVIEKAITILELNYPYVLDIIRSYEHDVNVFVFNKFIFLSI